MFWHEDEDRNIPYTVPDDITDISFALTCKQLPIDHISDLSQAIQSILPWVNDENIGIHPIHVAESGNGWMRPDENQVQMLYPSKRTRFMMRIPKHRINDATALTGQTIKLLGHPLIFGKTRLKPLLNSSVIFSRYILSNETESENDFLTRMAAEIKQLTTVTIKKMLCGRSHTFQHNGHTIHTRHLMIADLDNDPSIKIQQKGLGDKRVLGCGLFLPHKGIKSLNSQE